MKTPKKFAIEVEFLDGVKMVVWDHNFSRATVQAGYKRYLEGAQTHKQLNAKKGVRRPELDEHTCKPTREPRRRPLI